MSVLAPHALLYIYVTSFVQISPPITYDKLNFRSDISDRGCGSSPGHLDKVRRPRRDGFAVTPNVGSIQLDILIGEHVRLVSRSNQTGLVVI